MRNYGLSGKVKFGIRERDELVWEGDWQPNLILDQGLDQVQTNLFNQLFANCAVGTGAASTQFSSGTTTATVAGTTVTADTAFFTAQMVGGNIVFSNGDTFKIASVTSPPSNTCMITTSGTVASPLTFMVYQVQQTGLGSETKRTNNYVSTPGACGASVLPGSVILYRTFLFTPEPADITYTEVGLSPFMGPGNNLFSRIKLGNPIEVSGPTPELPSGQQLQVTYQLTVNFDYGQGPGVFFAGVTAQSDIAVTNLPVPSLVWAYQTSLTQPGKLSVTVFGFSPFIVGDDITLSGSAVPGYNGTWQILDLSTFTDPTNGPSTVISLGVPYSSTPSISGDNVTTDLSGAFFRACQGIFLISTSGQSAAPAATSDTFLGYGEPSIVNQIWISTVGSNLLGGNGAPSRIDPSLYSVEVATPLAYTPGNFYQDQQAVVTISSLFGSQANIASLGLGVPDQTNQIETFYWNQPQGLLSGGSMTLTFRVSWGRM